MKLTKERTPYLLLNFGDLHEANVIVMQFDDTAIEQLKNYRDLLVQIKGKSKNLSRIQFDDTFSFYLRVEKKAHDFLKDWDGNHMFIKGTEEEITGFINENYVAGGEGNYISVYSDGTMMVHVYDYPEYNRFDEFFTEQFNHLLP